MKIPRTHSKPVQTLWKPHIIPPDFVLVIDTREQTPLFRKPPKGLPIIRDTLTHGDYCIQGFEDYVFIERKVAGQDFCSYIGKEHERTKAKLEAITLFDVRHLVIEGDPYDTGMYSQLTHEHVRGFLNACRVKYGIHTFWSKDRAEIERYVLDTLLVYFNHLRKP
jgi:ERCC4-type nuclease